MADSSSFSGDCRPDKIAAKLVSARASRKITEVHDLFLFMAFHKVTLEYLPSVHTARARL